MAIQSRPPALTPALPHFATSSTRPAAEALWTSTDLFPTWPVRISAYADQAIQLKPLRSLIKPDLLLYWSPAKNAKENSDRLPLDATLLGSVGGTQIRQFQIPAPGPAVLTLYSLGHQEVVASADFPGFRKADPR